MPSYLAIRSAVAAGLVFCSPARHAEAAGHAGDRSGASEVQVSTEDLDLSLARDQDVLARRLEHASRDVCGLFEQADPTSRAYRECHAEAIADAMAQMHARIALAAMRVQLAANERAATR